MDRNKESRIANQLLRNKYINLYVRKSLRGCTGNPLKDSVLDIASVSINAMYRKVKIFSTFMTLLETAELTIGDNKTSLISTMDILVENVGNNLLHKMYTARNYNVLEKHNANFGSIINYRYYRSKVSSE